MRNFKQIRRRGLPLLLALVMCLSLVQVPAFAEEGAVPSDYPEILQETAGEPGDSENSESQKQPEMPEISDSTENTGTPAAPEDPEVPAAPAVPENPEGPDAAGTGEETSEEGTEGNDLSDTEDILPEEVQAFLDAVNALWDQADSDDAEAMLAAVEEAEELYDVLTGEQKELPQVQQCRAALDAFWETVTLEENEPVTATTEEELREAVAAGGEVKLGEDIILTSTLEISKTVTLDLNGCTLIGSGNGSVIKVTGEGTVFTLTDTGESGTITGGNANDGRGGGVYVAEGTFIMTGGAIKDCTASRGGGVYVANGTFTLSNDGEISGNTSRVDGGGVFVDKAGSLTISGGAISGNTASCGGGVYMDGGTFTMTGGDVSSNIAPKPKNDGHGCAGAGVYMNGGVFTMSNSTISGNHATGETSTTGGVSLNNGAKFTMTNSRITGNIADRHQAGGVLVGGNCSFIMESGTISGNECRDGGGGVSVNGSGASFLMKSGTISGNTVHNGLAIGGGVSVLRGEFTMENGTIENNTAINNGDSNPQYELKGPQLGLGGGVSVVMGGTFTMKNGVIRGNTVSGKRSQDLVGGVGGGGGVALFTDCSFTMENGTITGNTAKANEGEDAPYSGGGVYILGSTFTRTGGVLCNNTAETAGADVYAAGATVTLGDISKEGWMLTVGDAGHHKITGWFQDTADTRWACDAPTAEHTTYDAQTAPAGGLFLKAAHGLLCKLTVKYVNEQGEEISSTVIEQDKGSQYTVTPKAPDGYEIKEIQGDTSGTLDENKEIVVICYQPKVTVTWRNGYNDTPVKTKDDHEKGAAVAP